MPSQKTRNSPSDSERISDEVKRILREQTIDETGPGTILHDFDALLDFVGEEGLKTTSKYFLLPQGKLDELNTRMSRPVPHRLKRPQQRSFPHLHGLYLVLRASGLGDGVGTPPASHLMIDLPMLAAWRELNAAERYFTLLESWLVQARPEMIAERGRWDSTGFHAVIRVFQKLNSMETRIPDDRRRGGLLCGIWELLTVAMMELFGWVRLEYGRPRDGEGVRITMIERLPFGDAMVSALGQSFLSNPWPGYDGECPDRPGVLKPLFQPYFPQWQRTLQVPEMPFREGTYTWRVSLGRPWRQITAPASLTLDDLAMTILDAFHFDPDHLYCFQFRDRTGRNMRIACPHEQDAESMTDEVRLGDLPLPEGGQMTFLFDYGDNWEFTVKLESVEPGAPKLKRPKITARGGRAPSQYEPNDWDEDD